MSETATSKMTREEVDAKFKAVPLNFYSYYKYLFTFVGTSDDGYSIEASYGGNAEDIYREEVKAADAKDFGDCERWRYVRVLVGSTVVFQYAAD